MKKSIINVEVVEDHPVEDVLGEEILSEDRFFQLPNGEVISAVNLGDYMVKHLGAKEYEAK